MAEPTKPLRSLRDDGDPVAPIETRYVADDTAAASAEDPEHWLHHMLRDKGIGEDDREAAVELLNDTFGREGLTVRLASKVLDLWLAARRGRSVDAKVTAEADQDAARKRAELESKGVRVISKRKK